MPFGFGALKSFANSAVSAATNVASEAAKAAETAATAAAAVAEGAAQQATAAASQVTGGAVPPAAPAQAAPPAQKPAPVQAPPPPAVVAPAQRMPASQPTVAQPPPQPQPVAAVAQPQIPPTDLGSAVGTSSPGPRGPGGLRPRGPMPPRGPLTPRGTGPPGGFPPGPPGGPRMRGPRPPGPRGQAPGGTTPRGPRPPWTQGQPPGQGPPGSEVIENNNPNNATPQTHQPVANQQPPMQMQQPLQQQQQQPQQQQPVDSSVSNVVQGQNQMGYNQMQQDPSVQPQPMDNSRQMSLQQNPGQSDTNIVRTSGAINHINDPGLLQPNDMQQQPQQQQQQPPNLQDMNQRSKNAFPPGVRGFPFQPPIPSSPLPPGVPFNRRPSFRGPRPPPLRPPRSVLIAANATRIFSSAKGSSSSSSSSTAHKAFPFNLNSKNNNSSNNNNTQASNNNSHIISSDNNESSKNGRIDNNVCCPASSTLSSLEETDISNINNLDPSMYPQQPQQQQFNPPQQQQQPLPDPHQQQPFNQNLPPQSTHDPNQFPHPQQANNSFEPKPNVPMQQEPPMQDPYKTQGPLPSFQQANQGPSVQIPPNQPSFPPHSNQMGPHHPNQGFPSQPNNSQPPQGSFPQNAGYFQPGMEMKQQDPMMVGGEMDPYQQHQTMEESYVVDDNNDEEEEEDLEEFEENEELLENDKQGDEKEEVLPAETMAPRAEEEESLVDENEEDMDVPFIDENDALTPEDEDQFRSNFEGLLNFHEEKTKKATDSSIEESNFIPFSKQDSTTTKVLGAVANGEGGPLHGVLVDVPYPGSPEDEDFAFRHDQGHSVLAGSLAGEVYTIPEEPEAEEGSPTGGDGVSRKRDGGGEPPKRALVESSLLKTSKKPPLKRPPLMGPNNATVKSNKAPLPKKPLPKTSSPKKTTMKVSSMSEVDRRVLMKSPVTVRSSSKALVPPDDEEEEEEEDDVPLVDMEDLEDESYRSEGRAPVDGDRLFSSSIMAGLDLGGFSSVSTSASELREKSSSLQPRSSSPPRLSFRTSPVISQNWIQEKEADLDRREVNLDLERGRRELERDRRELEKDRKMLEEFERKRKERELEMEREKLELEREHFRREQISSEKRERERREMLEREKIEILEEERREMEARLEEETLRREAALIKREREIMLREQSERERALELERLELEHQQQVLFETEQRRHLEDKEAQIEMERREKEEAQQKQKLLQQKKLLQQQKKQQLLQEQQQRLIAQRQQEQKLKQEQQQLLRQQQLKQQQQRNNPKKQQQPLRQQQQQQTNEKRPATSASTKAQNQLTKQQQLILAKENQRMGSGSKVVLPKEKSKKSSSQSSKMFMNSGGTDGCAGGGYGGNFNSMDSEGMYGGMMEYEGRGGEPLEDFNIYATSANDDFYSSAQAPSNHRVNNTYVDNPSKYNGTSTNHSSNRPSSPSTKYSTGKRVELNITDRQQQQRSRAEEILQREKEFIEKERAKLARERELAIEKEREYERELVKMRERERAAARLESGPSRSTAATSVSNRYKDSRNTSSSLQESSRNNYNNNSHGDDESISGMLNNFSKALGDIRDIREKRMKRLEDSSPPRSSKTAVSSLELELLKNRSSSSSVGQSHSIKFSNSSSTTHNSGSASNNNNNSRSGGSSNNNNNMQGGPPNQYRYPTGSSNGQQGYPGGGGYGMPQGGMPTQQQQQMGMPVQMTQQQTHPNMMRGQQQPMMNQNRYAQVPQQQSHPGMQQSQSMQSIPQQQQQQAGALLGDMSPLIAASSGAQQPSLVVQQPIVTASALPGRIHQQPDPLQQQALAAAILGQDLQNQQHQQQLYLQQMQNLKKMRQRLPHSKTSSSSPLLLRKEMSRIPSAAFLSGATLAMSEQAKPSRTHRNQGNLDTVLLQAARAQHGITGNWTPVGTPDTLSETGSLKSRSRRTLPYLPPEEPTPLPSQAKKSQDRMRAYANMRQSSFDGATRALLSSVKPRPSSSETNLRKLTSSEHYSRPGSALGLLQGIKKASSVVSSYGPTSATKEHEKRILENILPPDLRHLVRGGSPSAVQHMKLQIEEEMRKTSGNKFSGTEAEQARKNAERRLFGPLGSAQSERIRQEMQRYATMRDPRLRAEMKHKLNPVMDAQLNRNRRYRGHRRQLSDPRMTSALTDNFEDEYLIGRPYSSLARDFDPLAESLGMDNSQSYFGSGGLDGGGTSGNLLKDHSGLDSFDDRNRYLTNRRSQLIRRSSEGGLTSSYLEGGGATTSLGHTVGGGISSPLSRRAHSSLSGRMHSRSWHPSPFGSDDDVVSSDEPHFYKEEKKNRIKMEIARRRQQIEENACLHEELTRLAKLRETAEITDRLSGMGLSNSGVNASGVVGGSSNSPLVADSTSVLKSVDEVLRDPDSSGNFRSSSAPLGSSRRYGGAEPFNSDLYTSSVYDRVTDFSPIHSGETLDHVHHSQHHPQQHHIRYSGAQNHHHHGSSSHYNNHASSSYVVGTGTTGSSGGGKYKSPFVK